MAGKETNKELFETMPVPKAVRTMAIPTIIGQLIILIYNMADTFFVGKTNNPYMVASASLILPIFNVSIAMSSISGMGGATLLSSLLGEKRPEDARKVYNFCLRLSLGIGTVFSLGTFLFMDKLLLLLGAEEATFEYAKAYASCVIVLGGIPTILTNTLSMFVRNVGDSAKAAFGVSFGGIVNILLDPLFMFVILPEGKEILGAGIATCLSNCLSCLYFIIIISRYGKDSVLKVDRRSALPDKECLKRIFNVGLPAAASSLMFDLDYMVIDKLMISYDPIALAAVGITLKVERLPLNVGVGLCQGMIPIVAYNYAAKNYKRMNEVSGFTLICGVVFSMASICMYECFAPGIMAFFIKDAQTIALGTRFLRIRSIATVFMFLCFYHVYLFNGYGFGQRSFMLAFIRWLGFNIPLLFILNRLIGINGIVWAQTAGDVLTVIVSVLVHSAFKKRRLNEE